MGARILRAESRRARERLRRGHLVDQVQIDVEQGRVMRFLVDDVLFPDFFE